ncbi:conjugal transfer protein TrbL family protein [Oscillibacter ruminantium]
MDVLSSLLGGESLLDILEKTINGWIGNLVTAAFEGFDGIMTDILSNAFHVETLMLSRETTVLTDNSIRSVYIFIYLLVCSLVVLNFLFKGIQIYILWRDGDADSSPRDMLVGAIQSGIVMICFPYLYEEVTNVFIYVAEGIMGRLGLSGGFTGWDRVGIAMVSGPIYLILLLVFVIMVFILWIRLLGRGFELLILRLGVPFATLGLLDSDMGMFKGYMQIFIKTGFTTVLQVTMMSLAFRIIGTFNLSNILLAITAMTVALSTPVIMQQILIAGGSGGGGITQKAYSAGMLIRSLRALV